MITNSMELAEAFQVALSDGRKALRLFLTFDESRVKKESVPSSKAFSDRHKKFTKKKVNNTTASKETEATSTPAKVQQTVSKSDVITNGDAVKARIEKRRGKKSTSSATKEITKPSKPVPLQTTSGGAKLFLDGTVEFGFGGEAFLRPDGNVSCMLNGNGFTSVTAQDLSVKTGRWFYEIELLTAGCMQIGWAAPSFMGDAMAGNGCGDDSVSWAYDGYRQLRWHNGIQESFGAKWKKGDIVSCSLDCERGQICVGLNGQYAACYDNIDVQRHGGLIPAVSFSNGQKNAFKFWCTGHTIKLRTAKRKVLSNLGRLRE